jgi:hypothetical protein
MLRTDHILPTLTEELLAAVQWLQTHGRPELTPDGALVEAIDDWITLVRFEHLDGDDIPRTAADRASQTHPSGSIDYPSRARRGGTATGTAATP